MPSIAARRLETAIAALLAVPSLALASDGVTVRDLAAARRIEITISADPSRVAAGPATAPVLVTMPRAALLHRFRGELVDSAGVIIAGPATWVATFVGASRSTFARIGSDRAEFSVPRPYGVSVEAGEVVSVLAEMPAGAGDGQLLRVTLEYEPVGDAPTRLAVDACTVRIEHRPPALDADLDHEWRWTARAAGRLEAIVGPSLRDAQQVIVEDAITGEQLWRSQNPAPAGLAVERGIEIARPAILLEAGRQYRLRVQAPVAATSAMAPVLLVADR